jgi:molecular chaperone DnaK
VIGTRAPSAPPSRPPLAPSSRPSLTKSAPPPPPGWEAAQEPSHAAYPALPPAEMHAELASAPEIALRSAATPLLLDVTPQTLGVETVGGYCEPVIRRNAAIPVEQTRMFSTATDGQETVQVRILQGESRLANENQGLGEILLEGLRNAPRGGVQIGVTFVMDANGTLGVRARDVATGREQIVRIQLIGAVSDDEVRRMQERQQRMS